MPEGFVVIWGEAPNETISSFASVKTPFWFQSTKIPKVEPFEMPGVTAE